MSNGHDHSRNTIPALEYVTCIICTVFDNSITVLHCRKSYYILLTINFFNFTIASCIKHPVLSCPLLSCLVLSCLALSCFKAILITSVSVPASDLSGYHLMLQRVSPIFTFKCFIPRPNFLTPSHPIPSHFCLSHCLILSHSSPSLKLLSSFHPCYSSSDFLIQERQGVLNQGGWRRCPQPQEWQLK